MMGMTLSFGDDLVWRARLDQRNFMLLVRNLVRMLSLRGEALDMPIFEGKYDFLQAGQIDRSYVNTPEQLTHAEYKEIAETFKASMFRLASFYELPLQLLFWSGRIAQVKLLARVRCGFDPEDESHDQDPAFLKQVSETFEAISQTEQSALGASNKALGGLLGDSGGPGVPPAREGIEAVLAAMVMTSYAALETLAADLWVAAVNRHHKLAANWVEKNDRALPANLLASYNFNASASMGTILHSSKRVSFESLYDIKNLYSETFKGAVDDAFEPIDGIIKAEKTRHLFAHRGGLIDQKFKKDMAKYSEYDGALMGERLRLTGPVTQSHVAACANCAVALLLSVDNWSSAQ